MLGGVARAMAIPRVSRTRPKRAAGRQGLLRARPLLLESLEPRTLLDGSLVISELMALNDRTLADEDGEYSDWIEIYNPGPEIVDLDGWRLTDDALDSAKWSFDRHILGVGQYLVAFASGKDRLRTGPNGEYHTNFSLSRNGEYLALVKPDGTVASRFTPTFPEQRADVSYGIEQSVSFDTLVGAFSPARLLVPDAADDATIGSSWTGGNEPFDDSSWADVSLGVGFTEPPAPVTELTNVAFGKTAVQSTDGFGLSANQAVDGNRAGNSISHTNTGDLNPWWEVDLGEDFLIEKVDTFTRDNCCTPASPERDYNLTVEIRDAGGAVLYTSQVFNAWNGMGPGATDVGNGWSFTVDLTGAPGGGVTGRKVRISKTAHGGANHSEWLHLAEVEVFAEVEVPGPEGYEVFIQTDIEASMKDTNASAYLRVPFTVEDAGRVDELTLRLNYDDGLVTYLNGTEVVRRNAPAGTLAYDAAATGAHAGESQEEFVISPLHLQTGENVLAIHGLNVGAADADFLVLPELVARNASTGDVGYLTDPTPGTTNGAIVDGFVKDTSFDVDRGFCDAPFDVNVTTATPGATIVYTTDGTAPTLQNGTPVPSPDAATPPVATVHIGTTTTLRAAAFKPGLEPTNVDTQTYIFLADMIQQPDNPAGLPLTWDGVAQAPIPADYGMDPDVVNDPAYSGEIIDGLRSIPTLSLVMDPADLFGSEQGIYVNSGQRGANWERTTSVEILETDGTTFQVDSGIRIHGYSWRFHSNTPKHSFRLEFSSEHGPLKLEYPLFKDAPVDRFDSIVLRAQGGRAWAGLQVPNQAQYIRDAFARDTARDMGKVDGHAAFFHLYLNGLYWGLYHAVERPDAQMGEEYFGGRDEDYDALNRRTSTNEAIDGDLVRYNEMLALADAGLTTPAAYADIQRYVDLDNLIDIFLIHQYTTNRDGPEIFNSNNQRAIGSRVDDPRFRFFVWDMEYSIWNATDNINIDVDVPGSISHVYTKLRENPEFRLRYADRVHKHLFHDGALTPQAVTDRWEVRATEIETAIIGESARWGDAKRATPYTRDVEWQTERNRLLTQYFPQRTGVLIDQLRAADLYPDIDAPTFSINGTPQHGGQAGPGDQLTMAAPQGVIYFTTDGSDPRLEGGTVSQGAQTYSAAVTLNASTAVKARVLDGEQWSALSDAQFLVHVPAAAGNLAVTEINYNPADVTSTELAIHPELDNDNFEFLELANVGPDTIDLAGVTIGGEITFDFSAAGTPALAAGERVVIVRDRVAFELRYGDQISVGGQYLGGLGNGGGVLTLTDRDGNLIQSFEYGDTGQWPREPDGGGSTLEVIDTAGDYNRGDNWRRSSEYGGTPGTPGVGPVVDVVINEVLSHTDLPLVDAIELHNTTDATIDVGGWYLSDSWGSAANPDTGNFTKYRIPNDTPILRGEYLVLTEADFNSSGGTDPNDFALSGAHGDELWLTQVDANGDVTRLVDHVEFGAAANGESFGRWPNGDGGVYPMVTRTFGDANSGPRVGPVVISEIMYHPTPPTPADLAIDPDLTENDLEYVEIYNPTAEDIHLEDWRIRKGIDFDFVSGTELKSGEELVVLSFSPADTVRADAFRNHYGIDASVTLVGGYSGQLDNGGERVQLQRPDEPPLEEPDFIPQLLEDETVYGTVDPWPTEPDGTGLSLTRYPTDGWGHAATSWVAAVPTPGDTDVYTIVVTALTPTPRGFVADFDRPLNPRHVNLYEVQDGTLGPADVTLVGDSVGAVSGSLLFDTQSVTFVASGGLLPPDTYTVTLRSGSAGFQGMTAGELLDGNGDSAGGDDYVGRFTPDPPDPVVVSLPDFMRGPGQSIDVPATPQTGLPIHVNDADGITQVTIVLKYDPDLLTITDVAVGPDTPDGSTAQVNWHLGARLTSLSFTSPTALPAGPADLVNIIAEVPNSAPPGTVQLLEFLVVQINGIDGAATAPESVHVVGFVGDTTGNQTYSGLDAQRAARVAVRLDSGFAAWPNIDPRIVADVTGNGALSGLDAQRIALEAVGLDADEIPPLPQALRLAAPERRVRSAQQHTSGNESRARSAHRHADGHTDAAPGAQTAPCLTGTQLTPVVEAAVVHIESVAPDAAASLAEVTFEIVDWPGDLLGMTRGQTVQIDVDAAGYGWIVEKDEGRRTKDQVNSGTDETLLAVRPSSFVLRPSVDLLTVVLHELGHVLGYDHSDNGGVMDASLPLGTRRVWDEPWLLEGTADFGEEFEVPGLTPVAVDGYFAQTDLLEERDVPFSVVGN
jgi:hypothetical protein